MVESVPRARAAPVARAVPRSVTILGATGSIGASTIDLLKRNPSRYRVEAVSANRNGRALARIARELDARFAAVADEGAYRDLKEDLGGSGIEAVERGGTVALANKECLVCAGALFMRRAAQKGTRVLPVDSEHNALFQALGAGRREDVVRLVLTASGGPFRTWSIDAIRAATPAQALKHPNWSMGPKVTIDSATLMNKGLELIEAHHLFAMEPAGIDVVVHPQSVVHGLVEFRDGSVVAQLGPPDMRIPIAHCLAWPTRIEGPGPRLDLAKIATLTFET